MISHDAQTQWTARLGALTALWSQHVPNVPPDQNKIAELMDLHSDAHLERAFFRTGKRYPYKVYPEVAHRYVDVVCFSLTREAEREGQK
jgi:hypothetical protein